MLRWVLDCVLAKQCRAVRELLEAQHDIYGTCKAEPISGAMDTLKDIQEAKQELKQQPNLTISASLLYSLIANFLLFAATFPFRSLFFL